MSFENICLERAGSLAVVTLDRPKVLNALNAATFAELDAVLDELAEDVAVRVVLLTGAGERAFAAGTDIRELAAVGAGEGKAYSLRGQAVFRKIETLGKPVIACVRGFALGGGCELALACTLRIAADDAKFGQPEVKLGVIPGYGGSRRLPRLVGRGPAMKLLVTGAIIDAQEAFRIGLVDEVAPAAELMTRGRALAAEIAAQAPVAIAEVLKAVDEGLHLPLDLALLREAERFGHLCDTADKAEGVTAFLEKRAPLWKGR
ncbi:MAG TPA: enoyl-CoA hydratase-related protein [Terracidiphilus sp.]|jgi:enoyl-CoA hydratase